jgi:hypothetical protein
MRPATTSPPKRYHGVALSDGNDDDDHVKGTLSINTGTESYDPDSACENGTSTYSHKAMSPSLSRIVGRGQYSRLMNPDTTNDATTTDTEELDRSNNDETNSLVLADAASPSSSTTTRMSERKQRKNIFRQSTINTTNEDGNATTTSTSISRTPSGTTSPTSPMTPSSIHMEIDTIVTAVPTGLLSRQGSRCASSTASSVDDWDEDDEFDDDVVNIRRYHLEFGHDLSQQQQQGGHQRQRRGISSDTDHLSTTVTECGLNIVFDCVRCRFRKTWSTITYHWQSLRQAARQRRAARLLTMPSESIRYQFRACFISWCCDATDMGIAFTASCVGLWLLFGVLRRPNTSTHYWIIGTTLFLTRISARRLYDAGRSMILSKLYGRRPQQRQENRGRLGSRQHLSSIDYDHNVNSDSSTTMISDPALHNLPTAV